MGGGRRHAGLLRCRPSWRLCCAPGSSAACRRPSKPRSVAGVPRTRPCPASMSPSICSVSSGAARPEAPNGSPARDSARALWDAAPEPRAAPRRLLPPRRRRAAPRLARPWAGRRAALRCPDCPVWCWAARRRPGRGRLPPRGRRPLVPAACARTRVSTRAAAGLRGAAESTHGFSAHSHTEAQSAAAPMRGRTRQLRARTSASACRLASPGSVPAGAAGSWKLVRCLLVSPSVFHSATGLGSCAQRQARPQNAAGGSAARRMRRAVPTR